MRFWKTCSVAVSLLSVGCGGLWLERVPVQVRAGGTVEVHARRLATDGALEAWAELEQETLPAAGGETHVVVRVRAPEAAAVPRGRVRVHLVIDRSSSMQRTWDRVLAASRVLVQRLEADDELHIVAYGPMPSRPCRSGGFGPRAVVRADAPVGVALVGGALATALDVAGRAIAAGDGAGAATALEPHARWMEGRVELPRSEVMQARVRVVRRLSEAVGALVPQAGPPQRRQVAQAFGALAARFGR
jgi:hypothetical protein